MTTSKRSTLSATDAKGQKSSEAYVVSPEEQKRRDARRHEKALASSLAAVRGDREALKKLKRY